MIEYEFLAGTYDEPCQDAASVSMVYWTVGETDFLEIDEQFMAQFLGLI